MTDSQRVLPSVGAGSGTLEDIFAPLGQYRDRSNQGAAYQTTFMGDYTDFKAYPAAGCTDPNPLATRSDRPVSPTPSCVRSCSRLSRRHASADRDGHRVLRDPPPGVTLCLDAGATRCSDFTATESEAAKRRTQQHELQHSFCSYHGDINPHNATEGDASTILYGAIPWTAGTLARPRSGPPKHPRRASSIPSARPLLRAGLRLPGRRLGYEGTKYKLEQPKGASSEE